jgi:hypothetical protein
MKFVDGRAVRLARLHQSLRPDSALALDRTSEDEVKSKAYVPGRPSRPEYRYSNGWRRAGGHSRRRGAAIAGYSLVDCLYTSGDSVRTEMEGLLRYKDVSNVQGRPGAACDSNAWRQLLPMQFVKLRKCSEDDYAEAR